MKCTVAKIIISSKENKARDLNLANQLIRKILCCNTFHSLKFVDAIKTRYTADQNLFFLNIAGREHKRVQLAYIKFFISKQLLRVPPQNNTDTNIHTIQAQTYTLYKHKHTHTL